MRSLAIIVTAAIAAPAAAQLSPVAAGDAAEAVSACMAAARPATVDEAALANAGWDKGKIGGKSAIGGILGVYGKSGNGALIMAVEGTDAVRPICTVTARIGKRTDYQSVVDAIQSLEGVQAIGKDELQIWFSSGDRIIQSDLRGTRDRPSVRIAVMAKAER